jgi:hypothetical protein
MDIEVFESFTDYTGMNSGLAPMSASWLNSGNMENFALETSTIDPGNKCLAVKDTPSIFGSYTTKMLPAPVTKLTIGICFALRGFSARPHRLLQILDGSGHQQLRIDVNSVGKMIFLGENEATMATSESNFLGNTVYRCCLTFDITGANAVNCTGSINGFPDPGLEKTGVDLNDASAVSFGGFRIATWGTNEPAAHWELLDLIIGSGECVDWGPLEVLEGAPNVDIDVAWTPLSGTDNFAMVDEAPGDGDTTYNSTETLAAQDVFGFTDPEVPEKIIALGAVLWHKKEDSATRIIRQLLRIEGVDYFGPDLYCSESYIRSVDAFTENPATLAEWEGSDLAPLQFGYEYVGPTPTP